VRKVHHPKIVQRADSQWLVLCEDCEREREISTPIGINTPVGSLRVAQLLWENHCERRRAPFRREGVESGAPPIASNSPPPTVLPGLATSPGLHVSQ